jgi:hypothetical protein
MRILDPEDVADAVVYAVARPPHVCVHDIQIRSDSGALVFAHETIARRGNAPCTYNFEERRSKRATATYCYNHAMLIHTYSIDAIDRWTGLQHAADYLHQAVHDVGLFKKESGIHEIQTATRSYQHILEEFSTLLTAAQKAATALGWEGDTSAGPFVLFTPSEPAARLTGIAWKQNNNGQTFVMSLHPIPSLDSYTYEMLDIS